MRRIPDLAFAALLLVGCDGDETLNEDGALLLLQTAPQQPERDELGRLVTVQARGGSCVALLTDYGTGQYGGANAPATCWSVPVELSSRTVTIEPLEGEATVRAFLFGEVEGESIPVPGLDVGPGCSCAEDSGVVAQGVLVVDGDVGGDADDANTGSTSGGDGADSSGSSTGDTGTGTSEGDSGSGTGDTSSTASTSGGEG